MQKRKAERFNLSTFQALASRLPNPPAGWLLGGASRNERERLRRSRTTSQRVNWSFVVDRSLLLTPSAGLHRLRGSFEPVLLPVHLPLTVPASDHAHQFRMLCPRRLGPGPNRNELGGHRCYRVARDRMLPALRSFSAAKFAWKSQGSCPCAISPARCICLY